MKVIIKDAHTLKPKLIDVGAYTYGHEGTKLVGSYGADLSIGKFCSIAWGFQVFLGGKHKTHWISAYPFGYSHPGTFTNFPAESLSFPQGKEYQNSNADVIIGNDVWIGGDVTIMSGVKIGDGAIISYSSTVFSNVKPYSIVGGNPATFWGFRFDEQTINKLLEIKWWDWPKEKINEALPLICSDNPDILFEFYEKNIKNENN